MLFRFSAIAFLFYLASSVCAETPPEEAAAISQLKGIPSNLQKNRDGTVRFVRFSKAIVNDEHLSRTAAFSRLDYLAVVTPNVTDTGLAHVGQLTNLDTLFLSGSSIGDATLLRLRTLKKLEHLYLDRTRVTDAGLRGVVGLGSLKTLSLAETQVGDAGVELLSAVETLEHLDLSNSRVTAESLPMICRLPELRVLSLQGTSVDESQISLLAEMKSLETLNLRRFESLSLESVESLCRSQSLRLLDVRQTALTDKDVAKLMTRRASLKIVADPPKSKLRNAYQKYLAGEPLKRAEPLTPSTTSNAIVADPNPVLAHRRFESGNQVPDFQRHVVPLFGRLGCNGRTCHGSFQGKGGFNLSMFGYDFDADLQALTGGKKPRVDREDVDASLILNKPTSDEEHGGGQRFAKGGWEYKLLKKWIARGAAGVEGEPSKLIAFDVTPHEVLFENAGDTVQLRCVAIWQDGSCEDVTALTRFQSNDETVAAVTVGGRISCNAPGDTCIVAFYDNGIASIPVIMPVSDQTGPHYPAVSTTTEVDRLIVRKLSKLGIVPSPVCSDEQFLRRVSLDMVGTLPSPVELARFIADTSVDKRAKKIDELLESEAYATWWAVKLADLTGSNSQALGSTDMNSPASEQWNAWIRRRLADNVGWDRIAAGIILATSRRPDQTYDSYVAEQSLHLKKREGTDFTSLDNPMHYYWFRSNNQTVTDRALTFGYTFMGVRLQCAQCHKHPFDQWSKDDFEKFAGFFKRIRTGAAPDAKVNQAALKTKLGVPTKLDTAALRRQMYLRVSAEGLPIPWNEVYIEPAGDRPWPAQILGGDEFDLNEFNDPREPLFAWLVEKDNSYFAPAFVNRVWAHYFGRGIVDPPDDFNMANPPVNREVLHWLSQQFIKRDFDIKWLHRTIANSDTYQRSSVVTETNRTDDRNFSHAIVRRLPAEVTIDAILRATARDDVASKYLKEMSGRKTGQHPRSFQARGIDYSLLVFGKPRRTTSCDCERQDSPTLLQSLYVRNDAEMIGWLERPDGWLTSVANELRQPLVSEVKNPAGTRQDSEAGAFVSEEQTTAFIRLAYRRTLTREPTEGELTTSLEHISRCENTVEGLRDVLWALLNTQEFLTNH